MTTEQLHKLVNERKCEEDDHKELHKSLNLEIRFRKLSLTEVKNTCPLFRLKGLSVDQKVKNLESLIYSQLDLNVLADMGDLESVIVASEIKELNVEVQLAKEQDHTVDDDGENSKKKDISKKKEISKRKESSAQSSIQPHEPDAKVGAFVLALLGFSRTV